MIEDFTIIQLIENEQFPKLLKLKNHHNNVLILWKYQGIKDEITK